MRKALAILALCCVGVSIAAPAFARPSVREARHSRYANVRYCRGDWHYSFEARAIALCEADLWNVSRQKTDCVGSRESTWYYRADNGSHRGLFQMSDRYWRTWWRRHAKRSGFFSNAFNGRSNAFVFARMVATGGWGPWASTTRRC